MNKNTNNGFGLADAIVSLSLLAGIITYGVYFSSMRLNTVRSSNLIRSINKEIERDIERLKLDLWSYYYDKETGSYIIPQGQCDSFLGLITFMPSWSLDSNSIGDPIQSWRPGPERGKIFTGKNVLISREIILDVTLGPFDLSTNYAVATVNYRAQWGEKNEHWLSIDLAPEAHSWCEQNI